VQQPAARFNGRSWLVFFATVLLVWSVILLIQPDVAQLIGGYGHFVFLGLVGAIVANSTGAGGGIVFIPFFDALGLPSEHAVGTSMLIQCFGMTVGSLAWLTSMHRSRHELDSRMPLMRRLLVVAGPATMAGVLAGQYLIPEHPFPMRLIFQGFSILFGLILLFLTLSARSREQAGHSHVSRGHGLLLAGVCLAGGVVTAWISIGVGEWVAVLLLFSRFPTMIAVSLGVCMSSVAVLTGAWYHISVTGSVYWQIVLFAAPAAMIGGVIAHALAVRLGPKRLKIFLACWILLSGILM
jgi:uncharacterized membrane protein YfcA